jgi:membrane protein implicated in regulation of membrane protease activity
MNEQPRLLTSQSGGRNWLQRALVTSALVVIGAGLLVLMFFFVTVALVAGALLAAIIALRFWWVTRRIRAKMRRDQPLEGEYTVVRHEKRGRDRL